MSANAPVFYGRQFANTIMLLTQQRGSRFRGKVTERTDYKGDQVSPVDQVGAVEMQPVVGRFQPIGRVDAPLDRRWLYPLSFDLPQMVDHFDELKMLLDPKSKYTENGVLAAGRQMDRLVINAFFGTAATGNQGSTSVVFPSSQQVAVNFEAAGNTGMTVAKLRRARKILRANEVDLDNDPIYCAVTAEEEEDLLKEAQVVSLDYNEKPVLRDGKLDRMLGFEFVHSELLPVDGSGYRRNPCWAKSGMHLGLWEDVRTDVSQRKDVAGLPWQVYIWLTMNATRLEEKKTVEIKSA